MSLTDKDTSVVDALGQTKLEDLCLQPPLQEILYLKAQDIIQLHLALIEHTNPHQTPQQSITWDTPNANYFVSTAALEETQKQPQVWRSYHLDIKK